MGGFAALIGLTCAAPFMPTALLLVVIALVATIAALCLAVVTNTNYELTEDTLLIKAGPFRWRVQLASITELSLSESPMGSPALSLDRILIKYAGGKKIMISPVDREIFFAKLASASKLEASADATSAKRTGMGTHT